MQCELLDNFSDMRYCEFIHIANSLFANLLFVERILELI